MSCERFPVGSPGFANRLRRALRTGKRTMDLDVITDLTPTFDVRHLLELPIYGSTINANSAAGGATENAAVVFTVAVGGLGVMASENARSGRTFELVSMLWRQPTDALVRVWVATPDNEPSGLASQSNNVGRMLSVPTRIGALRVQGGSLQGGFTISPMLSETFVQGGVDTAVPVAGIVAPYESGAQLIVTTSVPEESCVATVRWREPLIRNLQLAELERTEPEV